MTGDVITTLLRDCMYWISTKSNGPKQTAQMRRLQSVIQAFVGRI